MKNAINIFYVEGIDYSEDGRKEYAIINEFKVFCVNRKTLVNVGDPVFVIPEYSLIPESLSGRLNIKSGITNEKVCFGVNEFFPAGKFKDPKDGLIKEIMDDFDYSEVLDVSILPR